MVPPFTRYEYSADSDRGGGRRPLAATTFRIKRGVEPRWCRDSPAAGKGNRTRSIGVCAGQTGTDVVRGLARPKPSWASAVFIGGEAESWFSRWHMGQDSPNKRRSASCSGEPMPRLTTGGARWTVLTIRSSLVAAFDSQRGARLNNVEQNPLRSTSDQHRDQRHFGAAANRASQVLCFPQSFARNGGAIHGRRLPPPPDR